MRYKDIQEMLLRTMRYWVIMICIVVVLFFIGEIICRVFFVNVSFRGISKDFFQAESCGSSFGNAPSSHGIVFGIDVHTDEKGFRVSKDDAIRIMNDSRPKILIIGDSVAFGVGVHEKDTFVGLMRTSFTAYKIDNSAVIGYTTHDYLNVLTDYLSTNPNLKKVFLIFCLNDISPVSASIISGSLSVEKRALEISKKFPYNLQKYRVFEWLNTFLNSRSKLFIMARNLIANPAHDFWEADRRLYDQMSDTQLFNALEPIIQIRNLLSNEMIDFYVVVAPYSSQVCRKDVDDFPQQRLCRFFKRQDIRYVDALPEFKEAKADLFLAGDSMHFSSAGHTLMAKIIRRIIENDAR